LKLWSAWLPPQPNLMAAWLAAQSDDDDYYRILGVAKDVSDEGLKRAYKRQALRWHPDKNQHRSPQAEERFKKVSEAYQVLCNRKSTAAYNRRRRSAPVSTVGGNEEVLFSKTYGWPGVNISFYWTGPPPGSQETCPETPQAKTRPEETVRSPLELFKDMFEMDSPLDGFRRRGSTGSIFESVFGSFKSFEPEEDQPAAESPAQQADQTPDEQRCEAQHPFLSTPRDPSSPSCTPPTSARRNKMAVIQEEYEKGDLTEKEYKELSGFLNANAEI